MGLKQLLCRHHWERYAKRRSNYCQDYHTFSDIGWWDDVMLKCTKCGKLKMTHEANEAHPLAPGPWQKIDKKGTVIVYKR